MAKDYYSILDVSKDATDEQIQSSFRKLALKYHPDKNTDKDAVTRFNEINEAYQVLGDKDKKLQYDSPQSFNFSSIFNSAFTGFNQNLRRGQRGQDIIITLEITLEEVLKGAKKIIKYKRQDKCEKCSGHGSTDYNKSVCPKCKGSGQIIDTRHTGFFMINSATICDQCSGSGHVFKNDCVDCNGTGRVLKESIVNINVDVGTMENNDMVLKYYGHVGDHNGISGNLIIKFKIKEHAYFKRQDHDIVYVVHLLISQAVLGHAVKVKTLVGSEEDINISASDVNVGSIILQNKGLPYDGKRGNQIIKLVVDIPQQLTDSQKMFFESIKREGL
jgi:molecular chaperone DnaJ